MIMFKTIFQFDKSNLLLFSYTKKQKDEHTELRVFISIIQWLLGGSLSQKICQKLMKKDRCQGALEIRVLVSLTNGTTSIKLMITDNSSKWAQFKIIIMVITS